MRTCRRWVTDCVQEMLSARPAARFIGCDVEMQEKAPAATRPAGPWRSTGAPIAAWRACFKPESLTGLGKAKPCRTGMATASRCCLFRASRSCLFEYVARHDPGRPRGWLAGIDPVSSRSFCFRGRQPQSPLGRGSTEPAERIKSGSSAATQIIAFHMCPSGSTARARARPDSTALPASIEREDARLAAG